MNKLLLIALSFVTLQLSAQNIIEREFDYLLDIQDKTHVSVSGKMFEILQGISANIEVDGEDAADVEEVKEFLGSIQSFELVAAEVPQTKNRFRQSYNYLKDDYEELLSVRDNEGDFSLLIDETKGTVHEVVGIGNGDGKLLVFSLLGEIKLEHVGKIVNHINNADMEIMSEVNDLEVGKVKVYPNPAKSGSKVTVDTPKAFKGGEVILYNQDGKALLTQKVTGENTDIRLDNLLAGTYNVHISKDGATIKKRIIVVD